MDTYANERLKPILNIDFSKTSSMNLSPVILKTIEHYSAEQISTRQTYSPGNLLFKQGDNANCLYALESGMVKLIANLDNGKSRIIRLHSPGHLIGLDGLIEPDFRYEARAMTETTVTIIPASVLIKIKKQAPYAYCEILLELNRYLRLADTWITEFSSGPSKQRIAKLLFFLSKEKGSQNNRFVSLPKNEEIADTLGITPENSSRIVAGLKRQGALKPLKKHATDIHRLEVKKLAAISNTVLPYKYLLNHEYTE